MRESWTDGRLDDLNGRTGLGDEVRGEFVAFRREMKEGFDRIDRRFERMDERFERMDARLLAIYRTMLWFCGTAMAALIGLIATQI